MGEEFENATWGRHHESIRERLDRCGDYVDRLTRALGGEIGFDRTYVHGKAAALSVQARSLLRHCQDVERSLNLCDVPIRYAEGGYHFTESCRRSAGHDDDHDPHPAFTPAEAASADAHKLADIMDDVSGALGGLTIPAGDEHRTPMSTARGDRPEQLRYLRDQLAEVSRLATGLSHNLHSIQRSIDQPAPHPPQPPQPPGQHRPPPGRPLGI